MRDVSHVSVTPDIITVAAADLETIGSTLDAAHLAAAAPTLALVPAAADEVSAGIAQLFAQHAQEYRAAAGQAAAYQDQIVQNLRTGAISYSGAESVNNLLLNGLFAIQVGPSVGMVLAALTYANWVSSWIYLMPAFVQAFAYLPAAYLLLGAFLWAVGAAIILPTIASAIG